MAARRWEDDLAEANVTAAAWVAQRLTQGRSYVDLSPERTLALSARFPHLARATVDAAERVLRHEFDLLGSGPYVPADPDRTETEGYRPIDWSLDPVSGLRFPKGVPIETWDLYAMRPGLADVKLPWELARCQHWPVLGQAYRLTGDDRFAVEIARELRDFMESNPIGTAVNWSCTMDVALRAANWAIGLELVRDCAVLSTAFWINAYRALFEHGAFIEGHLENTYEVTSNHFLSNAVGLFYLAPVFRDLRAGAAWNTACRGWIAREVGVQVLPDGADFESSVPYHRLVSELFLGAVRVADYSGEPFEEPVLHRVRGMIDYLAGVIRPDGLMPQIGDADDGRLHMLGGYGESRPQDPRHLFGAAAAVFGRPEWLDLADEWSLWEAEWWGLTPATARTSAGPNDRDGVRHCPDAGVTVFRRDADYLIVTNGIVGTGGFGNHKHNDLLAFEYHVGGQAVLVDPGSYVYTSDPDARNLFRSTRSHNTVMVDGEEQNTLRPDWLFRLFENATPQHLAVVDREDRFEYRGCHRGYARLKDPVTHQRTFTMSRSTGALTIVDAIEGHGVHRLAWHFHFAPGVRVASLGPGLLQVRTADKLLAMTVPAIGKAVIHPAWYSPSYGLRVPCLAVDLTTEERLAGRSEYVFQLTNIEC